jgi:hypothetical protein
MAGDLKTRGFVAVAHALSSQACELAARYALLQEAAGISPDDQVPGAHSMYGDLMTESLEAMLWPEIERISGDPLWPTYSYYRVYRPGDVLVPHRDRMACEISATVCLGFDYADDEGSGYTWPLWVRPLTSDGVTGQSAAPLACAMAPGDMVVYRGCDVEHWRDAFLGRWQVQAFLHYVRRDGPFGDLAKFDGRPALGTPQSARDPEKVRQMAAIDAFLRRPRPYGSG